MKKKLKIVNKKRFIISIFLLILVFVIIFVITVYANETARSDTEYEQYIVAPGDTLWDIASEYKKEKDIRTYLYKLKKINDIKTSEISIGMKIKLP